MTIPPISLFSVLIFGVLRKNKLHKLILKAPQLFLSKKKLTKRNSLQLSLLFFRYPYGLKNRRGSFFLINSGSRKKNQKRNPLLRKNSWDICAGYSIIGRSYWSPPGNVKGLPVAADWNFWSSNLWHFVFGHFPKSGSGTGWNWHAPLTRIRPAQPGMPNNI